jgi:hypothetical protein
MYCRNYTRTVSRVICTEVLYTNINVSTADYQGQGTVKTMEIDMAAKCIAKIKISDINYSHSKLYYYNMKILYYTKTKQGRVIVVFTDRES